MADQHKERRAEQQGLKCDRAHMAIKLFLELHDELCVVGHCLQSTSGASPSDASWTRPAEPPNRLRVQVPLGGTRACGNVAGTPFKLKLGGQEQHILEGSGEWVEDAQHLLNGEELQVVEVLVPAVGQRLSVVPASPDRARQVMECLQTPAARTLRRPMERHAAQF